MGTEIESNVQKIPYPKSVFFIITNEFCERFSFYGMRTILVIYLNYQLGYSTDTATVIYHAFNMFCYFFPVLGAIIADSFLGKFKTILYLSIVYAIGNIVVSVTAIDALNLPQRELTIVGLLLIALGTGGIKPCTSAFGGDQFIVPEQELALQRFFSLFYFSINAGSFISTFVTPVLREDVHCFGQESCFFAAFGVPAVLMIISIISFVAGSRWYTMKAPEGNVIVKSSQCIWHALTKSSSTKREHWLDKADDKFDKQFIDDVKAALRVFVLYIPLPVFWALFDQQGSRWTFQATRMSGDLGGGVVLKPDQMQVVNPVLILVFIPLFETVIYPFLGRFNLLKRPLQKLVVGGIFAAVAFVVAAIVEFQLEGTYPVLPEAGSGQLRFYNAMGCDTNLNVNIDNIPPILLKNMEKWQNLSIPITKDFRDAPITWTDCLGGRKSANIKIFNEEATSYVLNRFVDPYPSINENVDKTDDGNPTIMTIFSSTVQSDWDVKISFITSDGKEEHTANLNKTAGSFEQFTKITSDSGYKIKVGDTEVGKEGFDLKLGGGYAVIIEEIGPNSYETKIHTIIQPNSINMLWLIPQYVIITAGEIMFSIPGLEFSFSQAPLSMKSLVTAMWQLTTAFGNLIVLIIAEAEIFDSQAYEFLLFAGLMFVDMVIFALMAMRYKYVEIPNHVGPQEKIEANGNDVELVEKNKTEESDLSSQ